MDRCSACGKKFVKYPIKDSEGKIVWKNMFKMDLFSLFFLISILSLSLMYMHDTKACEQMIEDPIKFCEDSGSCEVMNSNSWIEKYEPIPNSSFDFNVGVD